MVGKIGIDDLRHQRTKARIEVFLAGIMIRMIGHQPIAVVRLKGMQFDLRHGEPYRWIVLPFNRRGGSDTYRKTVRTPP
ncbi:hypothetical protein [uncultured Sulfitobacter sp.]|uniref:hypothetical protein n=1 Tax=uncultured Sulfitobacter sp. TaxID=191468 RepID=UPI00260F2880|nr:hypothetical protein [uncultured Sulfitobacter sp.]